MNFNLIKYKNIFLIIAIVSLILSLLVMGISIIKTPNHSPLKLGIDFTGGTILQFSSPKSVNVEQVDKIRQSLIDEKIEAPLIQILENNNQLLNKSDNKIDRIISIRTKFLDEKSPELAVIQNVLNKELGKIELLQINSVGPTLGKELFEKSLWSLFLAFFGIVAYLSVRFKPDSAIIAILALLHDILFVCGVFSLLGLLYGVQIDSLFITALLTVMGFSVHDTIIIYDRIRENQRLNAKKMSFNEILNKSVNQTLVRSINTSVTTLLTLLALYFFGGSTTKDFILAMILGIVIGTYSSIFFASMLLVWYRERKVKKASV